jgi:hypothetical protein
VWWHIEARISAKTLARGEETFAGITCPLQFVILFFELGKK